MTPISFTTMRDLEYKTELLAMMHTLYAEDKAASSVDQSRFDSNIRSLVAQPSRGSIVLFREGDVLQGYALLIPYWSNEFGGTLLYVDEIYVVAEARSRGIGKSFFKFLDVERPFDAVALGLEVTSTNTRARELYESLGFKDRTNSVLTYRFARGQSDVTLDDEKTSYVHRHVESAGRSARP